jgi:hypothetical protein
VAKCEAGPAPPKGYTLVCSPDQFKPDPPSQLTGQLKVIADAEEHARVLRDNWLLRSLFVFAIFCAPLVWYLFLDRIREVSAAVSGRDQNG